jgi:1,4-dihydroxy-2-naphthoyl-CoA hydrolase
VRTRQHHVEPGGRTVADRTKTPTGSPRIEGFDPTGFGTLDAPFTDLLGLVWDLLSPERVEAHLEARPDHHQPYGIVHGGVYASVVETVASVGAAIHALADGKLVVGVSNQTDFLRAHRLGRLDAVGTPLHTGRLQHLWQVELTRQDGKVVARGQVRLQVLAPERVHT